MFLKNKFINYKTFIYTFFACISFFSTYKDINLFILNIICLFISIYDSKNYIIPNTLIIFGIINSYKTFLKNINTSLLLFILLFLLVITMNKIYKKEMMGIGDIKLLFMLNLYFGIFHTIYALFIACLICLVIILIKKKNKIAFAPYICLGFLFVYLYKYFIFL